MTIAAMRDRVTHTLEVPVYHIFLMEIPHSFRYIKDLTQSQYAME